MNDAVRCTLRSRNEARLRASSAMTDYDYDPIPSAPTERIADDAMIRSATAYCEFVSQRRTVRQFSDAPID